MAYLNLEDETGSYEAVMFEKELAAGLPPDNTFVLVYVNINKSYDGSSINARVESVKPIEDIRRELVKSLSISVDCKNQQDKSNGKTQLALDKIKAVTQAHPGDTILKLSLDFGDATVEIDAGSTTIDLNNHVYETINSYNKLGVKIGY